jgi:hypothetical protein
MIRQKHLAALLLVLTATLVTSCASSSAALPTDYHSAKVAQAKSCMVLNEASGPVLSVSIPLELNHVPAHATIAVYNFSGPGSVPAKPSEAVLPGGAQVGIVEDPTAAGKVGWASGGSRATLPIWQSLSGSVVVGAAGEGSMDVKTIDVNSASATFGTSHLDIRLSWSCPTNPMKTP